MTTPRRSAAGLAAPARRTDPTPAAAQQPERASAANLTVRPRAPAAPPAPRTASDRNARYRELLERLQRFRDSLPSSVNSNDRATVLIEACISGGVRTREGIIRVLVLLGFNRVHAAVTLKRGLGATAASGRWRRGDDGRYRLLA